MHFGCAVARGLDAAGVTPAGGVAQTKWKKITSLCQTVNSFLLAWKLSNSMTLSDQLVAPHGRTKRCSRLRLTGHPDEGRIQKAFTATVDPL